jgi:hypothetical protein
VSLQPKRQTGRLVPLPESRQIADKPGALAAGVAVVPSQESTPVTNAVNSSAVFPFDVIALFGLHQRQ